MVSAIAVVNTCAVRLHCVSVLRVGVREDFLEEVIVVTGYKLLRISYMAKPRKRTLHVEKR